MQTFLPSKHWHECARVLDNKRLNKQILEGWQILMVLTELDPQGNDRQPKGWRNHPAVKMWRGYEWTLAEYLEAMVTEWQKRGFKTTMGTKISNTLQAAMDKGKIPVMYNQQRPRWMKKSYYEQLASTHRQALLTKNYEHYKQFNWPEDTGVPPTEYEYTWPV